MADIFKGIRSQRYRKQPLELLSAFNDYNFSHGIACAKTLSIASLPTLGIDEMELAAMNQALAFRGGRIAVRINLLMRVVISRSAINKTTK